mmetsp:Transcript_31660/g.57636  ORF Transcript_31660/g.57636 Transcript_31660/m.57636 type:complete len:287 (-) Transcript_31660:2980-3840(-)
MPLQVPLQSDHGPHVCKTQSTAASQLISTLQNFVSRSLPSTGVPHSLASVTMGRCLIDTPPPQVAEHIPHADQPPNAPSMQVRLLHRCVLQGSICSFSSGVQALPPSLGMRFTIRSRVLCPPPQVQVQALQACQSAHRQSSRSHSRLLAHALVCPRLAEAPAPPGPRIVSTIRLRSCIAGPHEAEHVLHFVHSPSSASCLLQASVLQPCVCMSSWGQVVPPFAGKRDTCRCRRCCPPPQVLSQLSQNVQSDVLQSTLSACAVSVSCRDPEHAFPPLEAGTATLRER